MRIIDWSSDVCSSDLLNVLQQIFAIRLALGIPIRRPRRRDAKAEAVRIDFMTHALFSLSDAEAYWPSETLIVMWLVGLTMRSARPLARGMIGRKSTRLNSSH